MEAYGSNKSKIFKVTDKRTFMHTSSKGIVTYEPNVRAVFDCAGILEIKDGKTTSNTMCKVTEDNGDIHYAQFNAKERFISTFTYISNTILLFFYASHAAWECFLAFCGPSRARTRFPGGHFFTPLKKAAFPLGRGRKSQKSHPHAAWDSNFFCFPCSVGVRFPSFSGHLGRECDSVEGTFPGEVSQKSKKRLPRCMGSTKKCAPHAARGCDF